MLQLLKILIATGIYPPDIGGPATYSRLLFEELPKVGFSVEVLSFGSVRHLPKIFRHFVYFLKILKIGRRADIIFAQDPVSVGLPAALAAGILGKKFILKVVGDYAWEQGCQRFGVKDLLDDFMGKRYGLAVEFLRAIQMFTARTARLIITPSQYLKNIINRWGIDASKIKVIYNAFAAAESQVSRAEARGRLNLKDLIFISSGRLVPWKGFDFLMDLWPRILKKEAAAKLLIIGDGPDRAKLVAKISDLKLEESVFLLGKMSFERLALYLAAADVFILNTAYEGFAHALLEALAAGLPVITTRVGGNLEIIEDGQNGLLVERNNATQWQAAVERIAVDAGLRQRLVMAGRETLKKFTKEKSIKEVVEILKKL